MKYIIQALFAIGIIFTCASVNGAVTHFDEFSEYAQMLNELKLNYKPGEKKKTMTFIPEDEDLELYPHFSDLTLAIKPNISVFTDEKHVIAAAPLGVYLAEAKGWTGFKLFFEHENNKTCGYAFINLALSKGKVFMTGDEQNFFINKKPGYKLSSGNAKSGYLYSVNWYDKEHVYMLDCASVAFDAKGLDKTVELAKIIDSST